VIVTGVQEGVGAVTSTPDVTIESIYDTTTFRFAVVYVNGGSPGGNQALPGRPGAREGSAGPTEGYLTPNQARNLGASEVATRYIVFVDNDVLVTSGCLETLVRCAEETGPWVAGPLYGQGELTRGVIHMMGGHAPILEEDGVRRFREDHRFWGRPLREVRPLLRREPCEMVEFHCMPGRSDVCRRLGPFDEGLKSALENPDFCMSVRQAGGDETRH